MLNFILAAALVLAPALFPLSLLPDSPAFARRQDSRASTQAAWERYTYSGEEFSVELPGTPYFVESRRLVRGSKDETEKMRVFSLYGDGAVFRITSYDVPHPNETLEYFAEPFGTAGASGAESSARDVTTGGFTGREFSIGGNSYGGRARVLIALNHAYVFEAQSLNPHHPSIARFFDSLTLSDNPNGKSAVELEHPGEFTVAPTGAVGPCDESVRQGMVNIPPAPQRGADASGADVHKAGGPYKANEVTRRALIVSKPEPAYTEEARHKNVAGVVRLTAVLDSTGKVTDVTVVKGLPCGMTEEAVFSAHRTLFFPAQKDGRDVSQSIVLEYNFNIY